MIRAHTHHARTLLVWAIFSAGCNVFDASLYQNAAGHEMGLPDAGADFAGAAPDTANALCGRSSPATLCPGSYLFCDGFEGESGTNFSAWSASFDQSAKGAPHSGTQIDIESTPVCLGQNALHVTTVGGEQQAFLYRQLSQRPGTLHVRFYFYLQQYSQQPFQIVGFAAPSGDYATLYADPIHSSFNYANSFTGLTANFNNAQLPLHQWRCLELTTRFDAKSGEVQLALDGQQLGDVAGAPTDPSSPIDAVNVGVIFTATDDTGTNDVYFDEIAFSPDPIGCQ
jgi:hypothetical protein